MITTEMKSKGCRCFALAAVLAMAVCAIAIVLPAGDSDAANGPAVPGTAPIEGDAALIGDGETLADGVYYAVGEVSVTVTGSNATIYLTEGASVGLTTECKVLFRYAADGDATQGPTEYYEGLDIAYITGTYVAQKATATNSLSIRYEKYLGEDMRFLPTEGFGVGLADTVMGVGVYYAEGADAVFNLTSYGQSVTILNGGAVTVNRVKDGATIAAMELNNVRSVTDASSGKNPAGLEALEEGKGPWGGSFDGLFYRGIVDNTEDDGVASVKVVFGKAEVNGQAVGQITGDDLEYVEFGFVYADWRSCSFYWGDGTVFKDFDTAKSDSKYQRISSLSFFGDQAGSVALTSMMSSIAVEQGTYAGTVSYDSGEEYGSASVDVVANAGSSIALASKSRIVLRGDVADYTLWGFITGSTMTLKSASVAAGGTGSIGIRLNGVALASQDLSVALTAGTDGIVVPKASTVRFDSSTARIVLSEGKDLTVLGTLKHNEKTVEPGEQIVDDATGGGIIYTNNTDMVSRYTADFTVEKKNLIKIGTVTVSDADEFVAAANGGLDFKLDADFRILDAVTIEGNSIDMAGHQIIIGKVTRAGDIGEAQTIGSRKAGSLALKDATIDAGTACEDGQTVPVGGDSIVVDAKNSLAVKDSKIFAVVSADGKASVDIDNKGVVYESTVSDVKVGYGTVLAMTEDISTSVDVYGTLVVSQAKCLSIACGDRLNVFKGASVQADGVVSVAGDIVLFDGSKMTVNGKVEVSRNEGGASFVVGKNPDESEAPAGADVVVSEGAAFTVNGTFEGISGENVLTINNPLPAYDRDSREWSFRFLVRGTFENRGTMGGYIYDMGTVAFGGKVGTAVIDGQAFVTAGIVLADGVSATVDSVIGGYLTITDYGAASEKVSGDGEELTGNCVILNDVRGIIVSTKVSSDTYAPSGKDARTDWWSVMDVSGNVTSNASAAAASESDITALVVLGAVDSESGVGRHSSNYAKIAVSDSLVMSKGTELVFMQGKIDVSGTIGCLAADSGGSAGSYMDNETATVTVASAGDIAVLEGHFLDIGTVNAAQYRITADAACEHYAGLSAALKAADGADGKRIRILGTVAASETAEIPAGVRIEMDPDSVISVSKDVVLTLKEGAEIDGSDATISVRGTFVAENAADGLTIKSVVADVVAAELPKKTWTTLANAIAMGMTDIVLNGQLSITDDLEIPAGVTVSTDYAVGQDNGSDYAILVDGAMLTVNGTLYLGPRTEGKLVIADADGTGVVVNGKLIAKLLTDDFDEGAIAMIDGAHFQIADGACTEFYITNLADAADLTASNRNVKNNLVKIVGAVSAGNVKFTGTEEVLDIVAYSGPEGESIVRFGTIALENAQLCTRTGMFTGKIATSEASFTLSDAGIWIESSSGKTVLMDGIVGKVVMDSGKASLAGYTSAEPAGKYFAISEESEFVVASGAEIAVPKGTVLCVDCNEERVNAVIDGTIVFEQGADLSAEGELLVAGTMSVSDFIIDVDDNVRVIGTLAVADGKALTIEGDLILGAKPNMLGSPGTTGDITGTVRFGASGGSIIAYDGASMSAELQTGSAAGAVATEYYINGVKYAKIYSAAGMNDISLINRVDGAIELYGLDTKTDWYAVKDYDEKTDVPINGQKIGDAAEAYATFPASVIKGTISKDAGVILTIDGIAVFSDGSCSGKEYGLAVGAHRIAWSESAGYAIKNVKATFNGQEIRNGDTIIIIADMQGYVLILSGAEPYVPSTDPVDEKSEGMKIIGCILIALIALIIAVLAFRLMRSSPERP